MTPELRRRLDGALTVYRNSRVQHEATIHNILVECNDALSALPPLRAREEIARTLYKSRGQFDDATVKLHFDWYLAQQGKPLAVRENPDARMAIVHCYRDADAVLALSRTAGQEWRVPEGWQLVPKEPTDEMITAARVVRDTALSDLNSIATYHAMLAACPAPPVEPKETP
jgi:hypothetical protein